MLEIIKFILITLFAFLWFKENRQHRQTINTLIKKKAELAALEVRYETLYERANELRAYQENANPKGVPHDLWIK